MVKSGGARTKVCNLGNVASPINAVCLQEHIPSFEVAVDDAAAVNVVHALGNLLCRAQQSPLHMCKA